MNLIILATDAIIKKYAGNTRGVTSNTRLREPPVILIILQLFAFFSIFWIYLVIKMIEPTLLKYVLYIFTHLPHPLFDRPI